MKKKRKSSSEHSDLSPLFELPQVQTVPNPPPSYEFFRQKYLGRDIVHYCQIVNDNILNADYVNGVAVIAVPIGWTLFIQTVSVTMQEQAAANQFVIIGGSDYAVNPSDNILGFFLLSNSFLSIQLPVSDPYYSIPGPKTIKIFKVSAGAAHFTTTIKGFLLQEKQA